MRYFSSAWMHSVRFTVGVNRHNLQLNLIHCYDAALIINYIQSKCTAIVNMERSGAYKVCINNRMKREHNGSEMEILLQESKGSDCVWLEGELLENCDIILFGISDRHSLPLLPHFYSWIRTHCIRKIRMPQINTCTRCNPSLWEMQINAFYTKPRIMDTMNYTVLFAQTLVSFRVIHARSIILICFQFGFSPLALLPQTDINKFICQVYDVSGACHVQYLCKLYYANGFEFEQFEGF